MELLDVLFQNIEADPAISELALGAHFNKARICKFLQMMRDRCLGDGEPLDDPAAGQFVPARRHLFEYLESPWVRKSLRDALKSIRIHISHDYRWCPNPHWQNVLLLLGQ